ncbi:ABC transporter ATP-binding protein [Verrucomicrobiota bacterium]
MPLLEINNLHVTFNIGRGTTLRAVNGVTLNVGRGESVGLVGESGCGKSTLSNAVMKLVPVKAGKIVFDGQNVSSLRGGQLFRFRRRAQMIFQDPHGSLNPRLSVGSALDEVLMVHHMGTRKERRSRIGELLSTVGLEPDYAGRYPHEFSGGQRQRIGIARALALDPSLIIADEPVSALDVSVQVQILNLMKDLQEQRALAYLFIAHDLAVVRYMCDRIHVMYLGRIMESAGAEEIFANPAHPYTEALMAAIPDVEKGLLARKQGQRRILLKGESPTGIAPIEGCPFHPRCRYAEDICRTSLPEAREVGPGHMSLCHFAETFHHP